MPPRFASTRSRLGDVLIYDRGVDATTNPISLHLDQQRQNFAIRQQWVPAVPVTGANQITLSEWTWANGSGGAGTTIETQASYQDGASDFGEFVNLRRRGVAQPAGKLTELTLPVGVSATTDGHFWQGQVFGGHLWITTNTRYAVRVTNATGSDGLLETDFPVGARTTGLALFNGAGSGQLYLGDTSAGLWAFDGASWTQGEAGTERGLLAVPYWTIGDALASGGMAGSSGASGHRLVGTNTLGTGFYYVSGDPKIAANWSALTTVNTGGSSFPIRSLAASNRTVFFGAGNGIYGVDGLGHTPNLTKWVELNADTQFTGIWSTYWAGLVWFTTPLGLAAFDPSGQRVDLARTFRFGANSGISEIYGAMQVMAPSEDGLYCGLYSPVTGHSHVGLLMLEGNAYRWSMAEAKIEDQAITYVQQVTDTNGVPHLFIGTIDNDGFLHLYVQDLPRSGDPEADYKSAGAFRAASAWNLTLSRFNGFQPVQKTARRFMLEADQLGSDDFPANVVTFEVSNDGGDFTTQGTATTSPRWNGQPLADTAQATSMQVRLTIANDEDTPVILRSVGVLYSLHPELSAVFSFPAIIGEGRPGEDVRAMAQRLERAQRAGPLRMDDWFGRRIEGTVSIDNERFVPEAHVNGWTAYADVTIMVTRRIARTDAGDGVDQGYLVS